MSFLKTLPCSSHLAQRSLHVLQLLDLRRMRASPDKAIGSRGESAHIVNSTYARQCMSHASLTQQVVQLGRNVFPSASLRDCGSTTSSWTSSVTRPKRTNILYASQFDERMARLKLKCPPVTFRRRAIESRAIQVPRIEDLRTARSCLLMYLTEERSQRSPGAPQCLGLTATFFSYKKFLNPTIAPTSS